jgi:hypothetical protein
LPAEALAKAGRPAFVKEKAGFFYLRLNHDGFSLLTDK